MRIKNNGLNDSDKVLITVSLWIAAISLFAAALTLPMLPDMVTIFYKTADQNADFYSKYNNLLIVLATLIPVTVLLVSAALRKRNKMQHNFMSIVLFCIMLSGCISSVVIYGICQQFDASGLKRTTDTNALIALITAFIMSVLSASFPALFNSNVYKAGSEKRSLYSEYIGQTLVMYWTVGAYGFLAAGAVSSFCISGYAYIAVGAYLAFWLAFILIVSHKRLKTHIDAVIVDSLDQ